VSRGDRFGRSSWPFRYIESVVRVRRVGLSRTPVVHRYLGARLSLRCSPPSHVAISRKPFPWWSGSPARVRPWGFPLRARVVDRARCRVRGVPRVRHPPIGCREARGTVPASTPARLGITRAGGPPEPLRRAAPGECPIPHQADSADHDPDHRSPPVRDVRYIAPSACRPCVDLHHVASRPTVDHNI
jgi:hypothetical protein